MLKRLLSICLLLILCNIAFSQSTQGIKTKKVVADTIVANKNLLSTGVIDSALYREPGTGVLKTKKIDTRLSDTSFYATHWYVDNASTTYNYNSTILSNNDTIRGCDTSYILLNESVNINVIIDVIDSICGCFTVKNFGRGSTVTLYSIQSFKIDTSLTYTLDYLESVVLCPKDTVFFVAADRLNVSTSAGGGVSTLTTVAAGSGISVTTSTTTGTVEYTVTNSSPDQVVTLAAGSNISITGTYPTFTITATSSAINDSVPFQRNNTRGVTWLRYPADSVGIGTSTPTTTFSVKGTLSYVPVVVDSTDIDLTGITDLQPEIVFNDVNDVWYDWDSATNGPQIVGGEEGQLLTIKSVGTGKMYLRNHSAQGDTLPAFIMSDGDNITLQYWNGTWYEVARTDFDTTYGVGTASTTTEYQDLSYSNRLVNITNGTSALLPLFSTSDTAAGLVRGSDNVGNTYYLRADGTWQIPAGGGSVTSITAAAGTGILVEGGTITSTGTFTITNTAPDQTVTIAGSGIATVTGTYPDFTVTATEVDGSTTNELQNISYSNRALSITNGTGTLIPRFSLTDTISGLVKGSANLGASYFLNGNGDWEIPSGTTTGTTYSDGYGILLGSNIFSADTSYASDTNTLLSQTRARKQYVPKTRSLTINGTSHDLTSDPSWTVGSVTSVSAGAGAGISISGSPITSSGTLTITNTAPDQTVTVTGGGIVTVTGTYPNFTLNATESDGSTTNEIQNLTYVPASGIMNISSGTGDTIPVFASGIRGLVPNSDNGSTKYLREDGSWQAPPGSTLTYDYGINLNSSEVDVDTSGANDPASKPWVTTHAANRYVPLARSITINGNEQSLAANRTWNVGTVTSINGTSGTGISVSGGPITSSGSLLITNTAPDQTVVLNEGTGIDVTGTYPTFTINNTQTSNATHTGDATGSTVLTLATVNSNVGTYNNVTVNAKGLVTAASNVSYLTSFTEVDGSVSNELQGLSYSNRNLTISSGGGTPNTINIPRFSTSDTASGFVKGSAGVGSSYFLNGSGNWAIPPDNNTTYSAGTGLQLAGTTFSNITRDSTVLSAGSGINISGTRPVYVITNAAPDQTVSLTGTGIVNTSGTYPNFTINATEVDGSATNEIQNLSYTASTRALNISSGTGATLPLFSTSSTDAGLVPGSNSVGATYFLNGNGSWTQPTGTSYWSLNGNDIYNNNNSGNGYVGIGTSTPSQQLEITKNLAIANSSSTAGNIYKGGNLFLHTIGNPVVYTQSNLFLGQNAGNVSNTGYWNIGIGTNALYSITNPANNIAIGYQAGYNMTSGSGNTLIGSKSLSGITTASNNTAIGAGAGGTGASTSNGTFLGFYAVPKADGTSNEIVIGYNVTGEGSNTVKIGNSSITDNYLNGDLHVSDQGIFGGTVTVGSWTLPSSNGTDGYVLTADASGNAEWTSKSEVLSSTTGITSINGRGESSQSLTASNSGENVVLAIASNSSTHTFTTSWTGDLSIANGGTGQSTKTEAFDALAPSTTTGDITYFNGTDNIRLGIGSANQVLTVNSGVPSWQNSTTGDTARWAVSGSNIYNKNSGTVLIGETTSTFGGKFEVKDTRTSSVNTAIYGNSSGVGGDLNVGGYFTASGGTNNIALYSDAGDVQINGSKITLGGIPSTTGETTMLVIDGSSQVKKQTISSGGSVTSVGLSLPSQLTVSGSPVTTSGTLTAVWADTTANKLFAGPSSGGASKPRFRTMVAADIPINTVDGTKLSLTSETTGDVMYFNGTDWVRLGVGTNGQVLQSNGTLPIWTTPAAGHNAVTLAASATTAGMSLNNQEIGFQAATTSLNGYLTSTDWNTFNGKVSSVSGSSPISSSGGVNPTISITQASSIANGYLSSIDWTTFNNKMSNPMTTLGDIIYGGASGTPTRLGRGTTGQLLAVKADNTLEWITPSAGTTYSAGYRIGITGSTINNTSYWKDQDTLKTTLTGIIKATAGKLSVAAAGVDYEAALTKGNLTASIPLSTGGVTRQVIGGSVNLSVADALADGSTKGAATFNANDFSTATAGIVTLDYTNGQKASGSQPGFLSSTDWTTFNTKIGGSLTSGYIPKANSSSTITNSIMRDLGTSIGVDTATSTESKFTVSSGAYAVGIYSKSLSQTAIKGETSTFIGVHGLASYSGYGVFGQSLIGTGVYGQSTNGYGVSAYSGTTGLYASGLSAAIESHGNVKLYNIPNGTPSASDSGLFISNGTRTVYKAPWPSAGTNYWQRNSTYVSPATITDWVGIGTTNPSQQLEITENFELPNSTASVGIIYKGKDRFIHNYGTGSTYVGLGAGPLSLTGTYNVGIGDAVLSNTTSGTYNTGVGYSALGSNTSGNQNTSVGYYALKNNTSGYQNTAIGVSALLANTTGADNISIGGHSLYSNTTGYSNTAVGLKSLNSNTTGYQNTAIGDSAFLTGTTYSNSTAIGYNAQVSSSNQMKLGNTSLRHVLTDGVIETTDSISIWKNNHYYRSEIVLDDDVSIVCPESWWGHGTILADYGTTYASFRFSTTGTVTLLSDCTSDVDDADTDGKLCIIDSGSGITIKNRLGTSAILLITITYSTTEAP